jgi:hypothetical protein
MATIISAVQNNSNMIAKLHNTILARFTKMDTSIDTLINKYQELSSVTANAFDIEGLKAATSQIGKAVEAFDEIENSMKGALEQKKAFNEEGSNASVREGPSIFSKIGDSVIFQKGKDALVDWIKSTDQYAAMQEKLKAMGTEWLSTESGVKATNVINNALNTMANVIEQVAGIALTLASAIVENWGWIAPIVFGIVGAILAYGAALLIINTLTGISKGLELAGAIAKAVFAKATLVQTSTTAAATAAQWGLNSALLANPIMWIVIAVMALIGVIIALVIHNGGLQISIMKLWNFIMTAWDGIMLYTKMLSMEIMNNWDMICFGIQSATVSIENALALMKVGGLLILQSFINEAIDIINGLIDMVNKIPGVSIDAVANVTFATDELAKTIVEIGAREEELAITKSNMVENKAKRQQDIISFSHDAVSKQQERQSKINAAIAEKQQSPDKTAANSDYAEQTRQQTDSLNAVKDNTGSMRDSVDINNENLEYMRDLAEQEVVNRFATAEIKVDMTNHMSINNDMDLDGVVAYLGEKLNQEMETVAEGVHI